MTRPTTVHSSGEALQLLLASLRQRGMELTPTRRAPTGDGFFHYQVETASGELYHLKFTKSPYKPKPTEKVSAGAKELDEKLKHAIREFGQDDDTLVGLNDNVVLDLLALAHEGKAVYFVTVVGDGRILWIGIEDFYSFVMRYDTFIKFARSNAPQAMVPTGWLRSWAAPVIAPPVRIEG